MKPWLALFLAGGFLGSARAKVQTNNHRAYSVEVLTRIARPVLTALAEGRLKKDMPRHDWEQSRTNFTGLEALGRTIAGIAPWLELGPDETPEGKQRAEFIELAVKAIANGTDPKSPDFLNFKQAGQPLVDTAFLAQGLLRAPNQLWGRLNETQRSNVVVALKLSRVTRPGENNWLLFSAMVEAALWKFTGECREQPIKYAVGRHLEWYRATALMATAWSFIGIITTAMSSNLCSWTFCKSAWPGPICSVTCIPEFWLAPNDTRPCRNG